VAEGLPCIGCGHNLRTLAQDGRRPECGKAVQDTVFIEKYHGVDTWDHVRVMAVVSAISIVVSLMLCAIMVWVPSGVVPQQLIGMACVVAICAIAHAISTVAMTASMSSVNSIKTSNLWTIAYGLALPALALYWQSFEPALGFIALLGLIVGLPAWGCAHIVRLESWVGSSATRLATCTCWLGRIAFWSAFVLQFVPVAYRSEIVAVGAVVVNTLYVVVLWLFGHRLDEIVRMARGAKKTAT